MASSQPPSSPPSSPSPPPLQPPPASDAIDKLRAALADRYEVERELGRGGMATVYLARDVRHDRRVAIKVLLPDLAASVGADRFVREIRVAAKLQHPHILPLYDSGAADGLLFYVMPFVEGESLRDRLDRDKMLGVDEAIGLTIEVAEALGYAHDQGIVHRDIKPENILLSNGHAMVADFGIARAVRASEEHRLTLTGSAIGTPLYMSPEQAAGEDAGPTSDLYSLACTSVEMLTGQPPFTAATAQAIMARHAMEPPPSVRLVRSTVPEEVEDALMWALAKVPADRPKNAAAFIEALIASAGTTASMSHAPLARRTTVPRLTEARRAYDRRRRRRRRGLAIGAIAGLALAGAVTAGAWLRLSRGRATASALDGLDPKTIAVLYFDDDSPNRSLGYLADGLSDELRGMLREVPGLRVISRGGADQVRGTQLPIDSVARLLDAGTLVRGDVEPDGGDIRVNVRLIEGGSGETFQRATVRAPASDQIALRGALAQQVAMLVRARLGEEIKLREQRAATNDVDAWVLLQRGVRLRRQFDSLAAAGDTTGAWRTFSAIDSLFGSAAQRDVHWIEPWTERARLAYARSRIVMDRLPIDRWLVAAAALADSALARDGRDPDALETRGNIRYWRWLNHLELDSARSRALLMSAKADLELAKTIRPSQAGAWASLSHLYYQVGTQSDVKDAAQRALEADAFLSNADVIIDRLFLAAYDDDDAIGARDACARGVRRFPSDPRFAECRLFMMTMPGSTPDPARAWKLADSLVALSKPTDRPYRRMEGANYAAAVLARAGLADSARATVARSMADADLDPTHDASLPAAFVYTLLGDTTRAVEQLKKYFDANPDRRHLYSGDPGWWFRPLEASPRFRAVVGR